MQLFCMHFFTFHSSLLLTNSVPIFISKWKTQLPSVQPGLPLQRWWCLLRSVAKKAWTTYCLWSLMRRAQACGTPPVTLGCYQRYFLLCNLSVLGKTSKEVLWRENIVVVGRDSGCLVWLWVVPLNKVSLIFINHGGDGSAEIRSSAWCSRTSWRGGSQKAKTLPSLQVFECI